MSLGKKIYDFDDLEERDLDSSFSLGIPNLKADKLLMPKDGGHYMLYLAHVSKSFRPKDGCPYCGTKDNIRLDGRATPRLVHDVSRGNYRVDIAVQPPRMFCSECKSRFTPNVPGVSGSRQMTLRLEEFLRTEVFLQPFTPLSERTGYSITQLGEILDEEIEKYDKMREEHPVKAPRVLGIDEKHLDQVARGTLVDVENGVLLNFLPDNSRETMIDAIRLLKDWDKNIKVVTTDMNSSYLSWLNDLLPKATLVVDKFHVIKGVESAVTSCRIAIVNHYKKKIEEIEDKEERARQKSILNIVRRNIRLFNFSMEKVTREESGKKMEQITTLSNEFPEFRMLHNLRYLIEFLYKQTSREDAETVWQDWLNILPPRSEARYKDWCEMYQFDESCFQAFRSFSGRKYQKYKPFILNYFNSTDTMVTNAVTEGLNSLIEDITIKGKGYEFNRLRGKCLYASLVHERVIYGINKKTIKKWTPFSETHPVRNMTFTTTFSMPRHSKPDYKLVTIYEFTTDKIRQMLPPTNVYMDTDLLAAILSDEYYKEKTDTYIAAAGKRPKPALRILEANEPSVISGILKMEEE